MTELDLTPFVLAVVPDAQMMTWHEPNKFVNQIRWIRDNVGALNIKFVSQVGDITYNNSSSEWDAAKSAIYQLDGVVPYALAPGNHDSPSNYANFNASFPYSKYASESWYGGAYQNINTNSYQSFSVDNLHFTTIHLAHAPDSYERAWAEGVLHTNLNRRVIIATHSYLDTDGTLTSQGVAIWSMIKSHDNVFMVVCGHMHGQKYITQTNDFGHTVHILLTDYQSENQVGKFRYYKFLPAKNTVIAYTYGVENHIYYTDAGSQFTFSIGPTQPTSGKNTLSLNTPLWQNDYLESTNAAYRFYLQGDGNLVLRAWPAKTVLWASGTNGKGGVRLVVQHDGNVVLYATDHPVWTSNTVGKGVVKMAINDNGTLVLYNSSGAVVWSKP